jgi:hypothetical protein
MTFDHRIDKKLAEEVASILNHGWPWSHFPGGWCHWALVHLAIVRIYGGREYEAQKKLVQVAEEDARTPAYRRREAMKIEELTDQIADNFPWGCSPEGFYFWEQVYLSLCWIADNNEPPD